MWSMVNLPEPEPYDPRPVVSADDLRAAFEGIPDSWYRTRDLLPRYNAWAESQGRGPVSVKALGEAVARELKPRKKTAHGAFAVWWMDAKALRGEGQVEIWESPLKDVDIASLPRYPGT